MESKHKSISLSHCVVAPDKLPCLYHTMFFIGTSNFELKLDFIIYSFLLRLQRDYRDYDALIMFNFYLFKELNGSVFFCEVLFLKLLKFKY